MKYQTSVIRKLAQFSTAFVILSTLLSLTISRVFAATNLEVGLNPVFWNWNAPLSKDTFTGSNGQDLKTHTPDIGPNWSVQNNSSDWTIQNNQLTRTAGVIQHASVNVGQTDMMACVDFKKFANEASLYSIMVRWQDPAHYWEIFYDKDNNGWQMSLVDGGPDQFQGPVLSGGPAGTVCISAIGNTITAQSPNGQTYTVTSSTFSNNTRAALIVNGNYFPNDQNPPPVIEASIVDNWIVVGPSSSSIMAQSTYLNGAPGSITNTMLAGSIAANKLVGSDIGTVGTITTGIWSATPIGVNKGGTGLSAYGTANQILGMNATQDGAEYKSIGIGNSGSDFGISNTAGQITFNLPDAAIASRGVVNSGSQTFGGDKTFAGNLTLSSQLKIREGGTNPTKYTIFQGADQTNDIVYTLPGIDGANGQVLSTNGSGVLSWAGAPECSNCFQNGGNSFGAATLGTNDANPLSLKTNNTTVVTVSQTGKVGIGDTTPYSLFTVGNGDTFQVNNSGAIVAASGIQSSGTIKFTGLTSGTSETSAVFLNGSNQLVTRTLGSNAFTNNAYITAETDNLDIVTGRNSTTSNNVKLNGGAIARGLTVESANTNEDKITTQVAAGGSNSFEGKLTNADLTTNRIYTLPDASGTFLMTNGSAASLTNFPVLNQNTTGKSSSADGLNSKTTSVNTSTATAPVIGQVLTATDATHATWQNLPIVINGQTISASAKFTGSMIIGDGTGNDNSVFNTGTGLFAIKPSITAGNATIIQSNILRQTGVYNALHINLGNITPDGTNGIKGIVLSQPAADNKSNAVALSINGVNWDNDLSLQNGATIDNNAAGVIDFGATIRFNIATAGDTNIGLCKDKADGIAVDISLRECKSTAGDIAEFYAAETDLRPGDVVGVRTVNGRPTLYKTLNAYQENVFSVVSTYPVGQFGKPLSTDTINKENNPTAIGISGKVPVRVSTESGNINVGDPLAASSTPGVAMKATKSGKIIGYALESFDGSTKISNEVKSQEILRNQSLVKYSLDPKDPTGKNEGKIIMYLGSGYYYPEFASTISKVTTIAQKVSILESKIKNIETRDRAGQTRIQKGSTKVRVQFENSYAEAPIVTALLVGANEVNRMYADNITKDGFDLVIYPVQKREVSINWHAMPAQK